MEWVAIAVNIARDPAVHRMAGALRVRVPEVVGLLALTFAEMSQHAPDGNTSEVPDALLESWAGWHGKRTLFAAQFRAELCDAEGLVSAWEKYNGANIRRAKAARERTRTWRETRNSASPNANRTHTDTPTERISVCRTEQDSTEQDKTEPTEEKIAEPRESTATADAETLLRSLLGEHAPAVDTFLNGRPAEHRANWYPEMLAMVGPLSGALPEDLAGACSDALLADPPAKSPVALRAFVKRRKLERLKASIPEPVIRLTARTAAPDTTDEDLWSECQSVVSKLRRREIGTEEFAALPYPLRTALRSIGGWQAVNEAKPGSLPWLKRDYLAVYRATPAKVPA